MLKGILIGALGLVVLLLLGAYVFIATGSMPANADATPGPLETWIARTSLGAAIHRGMPRGANPLQASEENLDAGIRLYARDCAVCHGASDGRASAIAAGLYQKPPQLARDGVEDDPEGETYWKVDHGIRFTGMPSFSRSLSTTEIWQLATFLKHMDSLPAGPDARWKAVPSSATGSQGSAR